MTLAKTIAIGATLFGLATGSALAYYDVYGFDGDGDGLVDSYLILEQSDTLG